MTYFLSVLATTISCGGGIYIHFRNSKVAAFRLGIIKQISMCSDHDILNFYPWRWRFETFENGPSYNRMLFSRKPLTIETWYKDATFVNLKDTN